MTNNSFLVIGAGSWGTALALTLARNGHDTLLWSKEKQCLEMQKTQENTTYLPGIRLPNNLKPVSDLHAAMTTSQHILIAVPSHAFESIMQEIAPLLKHKPGITWATKGLSHDARLLHEVASDYLGKDFPMALLTGPSFAKEVGEHQPTAIIIASNNKAYGLEMQQAFNSKYFRVYLSDDLLGAELGGAIKNVIALGVGIAQGLGFGTNSRAALITRGLAEMMRLGDALGAKRDTLTGLSGLGDLILTCSDVKSRNLRFGILLGQGIDQVSACKQIGQVVEGIQTTKLIYELTQKHSIRMPIISGIYDILYHQRSISEVLKELLTNASTQE